MFDLGWAELLVIGVVALIVVGPKDLPKLFRTLGRFTGKARAMAREFSSAMNQAADDAGVGDLKRMGDDLRSATSTKNMGLDGLDKMSSKFDDWAPDPDAASKKGPHTAALSEERKAQAEKIRAYSAQKAQERLDREAAAAAAGPVIEDDPGMVQELDPSLARSIAPTPEPDADADTVPPKKAPSA